VKKLLALLFVLGVLAGTASMTGCGDTKSTGGKATTGGAGGGGADKKPKDQ
jgi:hypothetical protein